MTAEISIVTNKGNAPKVYNPTATTSTSASTTTTSTYLA